MIRASLSLLVFSVGCFGSHGAPGGPGPTPESDAGTPPDDPPDDPPPMVRPVPGPPPTGCRESGPARDVRVDVRSELGGRCEFGAFRGAAFYDVSTLPSVDGLSLLVDFCPDADADCMCDVTVSGVGTDIIDDIAAASEGGLLAGEVQPTGIVLERPCADGECTDGTCACVPTLVLAAVDGSLDAPPVHTDAVTVAPGDEVCRTTDSSGECDFVMWNLRVATWVSGFPGAIGSETVVEQGQTVRGEAFGGVSVRGLRSSGLDCGGELPRTGAWVAWGSFEGI